MRTQREFQRLPRRVNCEVAVDGRPHVGVAMSLSPGGLFVQTTAAPALGDTVEITLHPGEGNDIVVRGRVAHRRMAPRGMGRVVPPGLGLAIAETPPDTYLELLRSLGYS
jgi:Tfp pilus assembly protein PilZ